LQNIFFFFFFQKSEKIKNKNSSSFILIRPGVSTARKRRLYSGDEVSYYHRPIHAPPSQPPTLLPKKKLKNLFFYVLYIGSTTIDEAVAGGF
jgi:hypothetical protein